MSHYEALIDSTDFQTVARYLHNPQSPIQYILHVKSESMLPELAAKLDAAMAAAAGHQVAVRSVIDPLLAGGLLRMSSRHPLQANDPTCIVATSSIPKLADCRVIYLPPFYLCHTPGLFEGTLVRLEQHARQSPAQRMKL